MAKKAGSDDGAPMIAGEAIPNTLTREQFLEACREQAKLNAERKALNEKISSKRKTFKSWGVELGLMDATLKMAEWDRGEVREHFDRAREYAQWINLPVGTQADMFAGKSDDDVQRQEWYQTGVTARLAGKPRVAPGDCPEQYLLAWDAGYDDKPITQAGAGAPGGSGAGKKASNKKPRGEPKPGRKVKGAIETPPVESADGIGGPGSDPIVH